MKYTTSTKALTDIKSDCLVLPVFAQGKLDDEGAAVDKALNGLLQQTIKSGDAKGDSGSVSLVQTGSKEIASRIILVGMGEATKLNATTMLKGLTAAVAQLSKTGAKKAVFALSSLNSEDHVDGWAARAVAQVIGRQQYAFDAYKSKKASAPTLKQAVLQTTKESLAAVKKEVVLGQAISNGASYTKDLGNQPGNVCTPSYLAEEAKGLAKGNAKVTTKVLDEKELEKLGMGAFVSVSKGSTESGKLIIINYKGGQTGDAPHVIVGKGITFDTGGISLKPGAAMDEMKYDMCGAASVLGTLSAIIELAPAMNIIGVIAAAENMPAGNASKPGDIVTTSSGKTVEILNTDAEGRLVLCDALTYVEKFKPASVVDIATLTGACIIALGHHTSGLMSNDQGLAEEILQAGRDAEDKAWQLPLWDEYQAQIDSPFADIQNIGGKGAGTITAGCFLSRFTESYKWAHLDIAGTAWTSGANKGATGRPVPLLVQYLLNKL